MTQSTMKKNGRTQTPITIQCNEETNKKSKIDTTHDYLHCWNSTDAMKLFVPPNNETVVDARQSISKRIDVLKDGFSTNTYE